MFKKFLILLSLCLTACTHLPSSGTSSASSTSSAKPLIPPASIEELIIGPVGQRMAGHIYIAAGAGPHPTVVLTHGYPGNEKSLDLAQALRAQGWNTLFFHYRGAWGSEGEFSIVGSETDVQTVVEYLRVPKHAKKLRVDPERISLIGHSMGGHMAVAGLLENPDVRCAVSLDGANMGVDSGRGLFNDPRVGKVWKNYSDGLFMLRGWSGAKAVAEMHAHGAALDLLPRAKKLQGRPVLLISADSKVIDEGQHILPLYSALSAHQRHSNAEAVKFVRLVDDHSFSNSRAAVIENVETFVNKHCR